MTFEEFLDTDRVQAVLIYEYDNELWGSIVRMEDGVLRRFSDLEGGDGWKNSGDVIQFFKRFCRTVITKETLLEM